MTTSNLILMSIYSTQQNQSIATNCRMFCIQMTRAEMFLNDSATYMFLKIRSLLCPQKLSLTSYHKLKIFAYRFTHSEFKACLRWPKLYVHFDRNLAT